MISKQKLALIHVGKKELGWSEEVYRHVLRDHGGVVSAKDLDEAGAKKVIDHMKAMGFWVKRNFEQMRPRDAALVGTCQSISAILHGFSRSGNTISVGLFAGLSRRAAAEFSFLLSIPTILAAAAVENVHAYRHKTGPLIQGGSLPAYVVGMAVAAVVGYLAISTLLRMVVTMRLWPFIVYCALLGLLLIAFGERISSGFVGELKLS